MDLTIQGGNNTAAPRDYRKGNWNLQETMVLIEAKRMDDQRRMKRVGEGGGERAKPAELRWKWVEDYCWKNGCFRSQNQCNDKWDNLMRDFKKVREYERRAADAAGEKSYWRMEKAERKDRNLPSNMLPQIYDALVEVVERKGPRTASAAAVAVAVGSGASGSSNLNVPYTMPSPIQQYPIVQAPMVAIPLPPPLPAQRTAEPPAAFPSSQPLPTVDSDTSEYSDSPAKRRRKKRGGGGGDDGGEGTSAGTVPGAALQEVGSAISRSASIIAEAIQSCEEREERRHREMVSLQERRLQIEESKAEINRQGINGLVDAINKLANSVFALASNRTQP